MDYALRGFLRHYALVLVLLEVQWRPVRPAPTGRYLDRTASLTGLLILEVNVLLDEYIQFHESVAISVPDDVPNVAVSGVTVTERLQDIYVKDVLFNLHLSKVEEYQRGSWEHSQSVLRPLSRARGTLFNHLATVTAFLTGVESLPTAPAPPRWSHGHGYARRVYGGGVIVALKQWLAHVSRALEEDKTVLDQWAAGIGPR